MSSTAAPRATRATNFPVILLWVASLAAAAVGYLIMTNSINAQAELYAAGSQDVHAMLTGQSGATLGTTLIGVGVLGLLLALAVHAHNFALAQAQAALMVDDFDEFGADFDETEIVHSTSTPADATSAKATVAEPVEVVEVVEVVEEEVIVVADAADEAPAADTKPATPAS
ncbi:hypothetical protein ASC66_09855 [Leifsonia sp. Root4]|uniref:hypothetical protein n=1 Tax=Leifsonia sp. Root4 TaxID=1736525 RepID=UPI0006FA91AC|nr:hypothetical protein [Leifsonia sp. Root4]KQW05327.1 hypothetical protein ASC66_09855 [Leifsonia sp. Root4]